MSVPDEASPLIASDDLVQESRALARVTNGESCPSEAGHGHYADHRRCEVLDPGHRGDGRLWLPMQQKKVCGDRTVPCSVAPLELVSLR